jgi:hypothetical protein
MRLLCSRYVCKDVRRTLGVETNVLKEEALSVLQAIDHALGLSTNAVLGDLNLLAEELQATHNQVALSAIAAVKFIFLLEKL